MSRLTQFVIMAVVGIVAAGVLIGETLKALTVPTAGPREIPQDWARVERTKQLSPTEELSLVIIHSGTDEAFDIRCLVYKNTDTGQSMMVCPESSPLNAPSSDWDEPSTPRRSP